MSTAEPALQKLLPGVCLVALLSLVATWAAGTPALTSLRISPLIVGIVLGVFIGNTAQGRLPDGFDAGISFSAKKVLRLAIILYGFRITFAQIAEVGPAGVALDIFMVASTLLLGWFVGTRLLGMDQETAILTSCGAAICGAAAVIATEPVVKAESHKTAAAVATVVLFGTLSMFLYPLAYRSGLVPLSEEVFGVYIGATVHEVAHVVGAGDAVGAVTSDVAVIVKMTRVMLLAPALLVIGWVWNRRSRSGDDSTRIAVPWFAVGFILVAALNSLALVPAPVVDQINVGDTFLLTMAMTGLGLDTVVGKLKGIGWAPFSLALVLLFWLVLSGFGLTWLFMAD